MVLSNQESTQGVLQECVVAELPGAADVRPSEPSVTVWS